MAMGEPAARWALCTAERVSHALDGAGAQLPEGVVRGLCGLTFPLTTEIEPSPLLHTAMCSTCAASVCAAAVGPPRFPTDRDRSGGKHHRCR